MTAALRIISLLGREPFDALTRTGCPTVAPVTVAVPEVQLPAVSAVPPMLVVVPVSAAVVMQVGQDIFGVVTPVETRGAVAVNDVMVP